MPTKPNKSGQQQNYVPQGNGDASGEYANNESGSNIHFTSFEKPKEKAKSFDDYTDELLKKTGLKTYTSKKYKNKDNEIIEIRRFGEGKHAIRYNQTKNIVEQAWYNGEKIN